MVLTLDDAVKVAKQLVDDGMNDEVIIRQELEQKCWLYGRAPSVAGVIAEITPERIASKIKHDLLGRWCEEIRVNLQIAVMDVIGEE